MVPFLIVSAQIAWRALGRNRLRTGLTMLGVVIGVAAVIAMVALGTGARGSVETSLKSAGTNIIQVSAGNFTRGGESMNIASGLGAATTLTPEDAGAIRQLPGVQHVAGGVRTRAFVKSAHRQFFTQLRGVEPALAGIHGWEWLGGRFGGGASEAVMGRAASRELFGEGFDPVGERITIGERAFVVSGYFRTNDSDMDETVFVTLADGQAMLNLRHLHTVTVSVEQAGDASRVADAITGLLRERHQRGRQATRASGLGGLQAPGAMASADDFTVKTQAAANVTKGLYTSVAAFALANMPKLDEVTLQEMSSTLSRAGSTMTALLGSIAAISLIVGGIGIMNIMLVTVTERTREIGLRMAIGARGSDVLMQFLVEAIVISLVGGSLGIAMGFALAEAVKFFNGWPAVIPVDSIVMAVGFAGFVGIFFGFYPARKAAGLDPIEALRFE